MVHAYGSPGIGALGRTGQARVVSAPLPLALAIPSQCALPRRTVCTLGVHPCSESSHDHCDRAGHVPADFEVPYAQHCPSRGAQLCVDASIPRDIPRDLLVPISPRPTWAVSRGVAVPEGSVDEQCHAEPRPRKIGCSSDALVVTAPPSDAAREKRPADGHLGRRVLRSHRRHDAAALCRRARVSHRFGCVGLRMYAHSHRTTTDPASLRRCRHAEQRHNTGARYRPPCVGL